MKKLIIFAAIICASQVVSAQVNKDTVPSTSDTSRKKMNDDYKDAYITMQAGKMLVVNNGKSAPLVKDKLLSNGTIVMTDGSVRTADGNVVRLKEGDRVYFDGRISLGGKDLK